MTDLSGLLRESKSALEAMMERAFEAGRDLGRKEATAELKNRMASMFNGVNTEQVKVIDSDKKKEASVRATPGTIKPKIIQLLRENPGGLTKTDIVNMTGFKEASVRGTLWTLGQEGFAGHEGGRWSPVRRPQLEAPKEPPFSTEHD